MLAQCGAVFLGSPGIERDVDKCRTGDPLLIFNEAPGRRRESQPGDDCEDDEQADDTFPKDVVATSLGGF